MTLPHSAKDSIRNLAKSIQTNTRTNASIETAIETLQRALDENPDNAAEAAAAGLVDIATRVATLQDNIDLKANTADVQQNISSINTTISTLETDIGLKADASVVDQNISDINAVLNDTATDPQWEGFDSIAIPTAITPLDTGAGKIQVYDNTLKLVSAFTDMWSNAGITTTNWEYFFSQARTNFGFMKNIDVDFIPKQLLDVNSNRNLMTINQFTNFKYSCTLTVRESGAHACLVIGIKEGSEVRSKYIEFDDSGEPKVRDAGTTPGESSGLSDGSYTLELRVYGNGVTIIFNNVTYYASTLVENLSGYVGLLCNNNIEVSNVRLIDNYDLLTESLTEAFVLQSVPDPNYEDTLIINQERYFYFENGVTKGDLYAMHGTTQNIGRTGPDPSFWGTVVTEIDGVSRPVATDKLPTGIRAYFTKIDGTDLPPRPSVNTTDWSEIVTLDDGAQFKFVKETVTITTGDYRKFSMSIANILTASYTGIDVSTDRTIPTKVVNIMSIDGKTSSQTQTICRNSRMLSNFSEATVETQNYVKDHISSLGDDYLAQLSGGVLTTANILTAPVEAFSFVDTFSFEAFHTAQGETVIYGIDQGYDSVTDILNPNPS